MERYHSLLLAVWREACRHTEIDNLLTRISSLVSDQLRFDTMALYFLDLQKGTVERPGSVSPRGDPVAPLGQVELEPEGVKSLAEWCRLSSTRGISASEPPAPLKGSILCGLGRHVLAVPLRSEYGTLGMLLLGTQGSPFEPREQELAELLREPMTVALENDRRMHELVSLREAAEADKRKLLSRLGRERFEDVIIGADGGLRAVMERVALVSRSDVPVLLLGETGSGKEVIARAIHEGSLRAKGPFIRVNCGAIPSELIDSELFGHERGSFTGAVSERRGWFERADEGTLFLDEIGELPHAAQIRLLRVLQEGMFERVGGEQALRVDVRIIAATHCDLARRVQERTFREDLWYRIAVFPVVLPPLRERKQDIPGLAAHFAERAARRFGLKQQDPTPEDIALLSGYDWPGNVREFASVLDRAAILGDGRSLEIAKALGGALGPKAAAAPSGSQPSPSEPTPSLDSAMRHHIERALAQCNGRIEGPRGAAVVLDINPHTLRARMRKLGIDWRRFRA